MKKVQTSILIMLLLFGIMFEILTDSSTILESVNFSFSIWQKNIFPSLFPFFVLSELFINYGFVELMEGLFTPLFTKVFKTNGKGAFIFFMSLLSGFPSNAKYTRELYLNGQLDEHTASKILTFSHFSNPLFILGTISILFLNNKEVGFLILICHYLGNIFIGLIFRNYYPCPKEKTTFSISHSILKMHKKRVDNPKGFGQIITEALLNSIHTLLLILGVVTMFLVITTILDNILNVNSFYQSLINGFFEMTQGLKYVSILNIPLKMKSILSTMIISFGGLSVHMQVISILSDTKIRYLPFLTARILHAFISSFLVAIFFDLWFTLL